MIIKQLLWALVKLVCASILAQCLAHTCPIDGMCSYVIFVPQTTAQGGYHYSSFTQGLSDFPRTVETVVGRKEYLQVKVKAIQLCLTLCDPMDCMVHGILQARTLEWVAFPFPREPSRRTNRTEVSCIETWFFTNWNIREAERSVYPTGVQFKIWGFISSTAWPLTLQSMQPGLITQRRWVQGSARKWAQLGADLLWAYSPLIGTLRGGSAMEEMRSQHHWSPLHMSQEHLSICHFYVSVTLENTVFWKGEKGTPRAGWVTGGYIHFLHH